MTEAVRKRWQLAIAAWNMSCANAALRRARDAGWAGMLGKNLSDAAMRTMKDEISRPRPMREFVPMSPSQILALFGLR